MKKKTVKYLDNLFSEGLSAANMPPAATEQGWAGMEQRLNSHNRRRRLFFWLRTGGGAGILAALILLFVTDRDHSGSPSLADIDNTRTFHERVERLQDAVENTEKPTSSDGPQNAQRTQNTDGQQRGERLFPPRLETVPANPEVTAVWKNRQVLMPFRDAASSALTTTAPAPGGSPAEKLGHTPPPSPILTDRELLSHTDTIRNPQSQAAYFYYGLSVGPDLSRVGPQPAMKTGYSAGVLIGYRFHRRWSAELTALWADKQYKTDGKYFDKEAAGFPSYLSLLSLDGGCHMVVVPLTVRYHFNLGDQPFFAGIGANAYFMKKERYAYLAETNNGSRYKGNRQYTNSGNHIFSHLQLSAGYSYRLSPRTLLRAEPYYNIPLKKIGIGNMELTSAGLQLAIIRE